MRNDSLDDGIITVVENSYSEKWTEMKNTSRFKKTLIRTVGS